MLRSGVLLSFYLISLILQDNESSMASHYSDCSWGSSNSSGGRRSGEEERGCWCRNRTECQGCSPACLCPSGCLPGHWGPACRHLCPRGWYGVNCSQRCGHCRYKRCNPVTGTCPAECLRQWTGTLCHIDCSHSQAVCWQCAKCQSGSATCDNVTGTCHTQGCPLPDSPHLCHPKNTCQSQPCTCGACLGGVQNCDVSTGVCLKGCKPGFTGKSCTQPCRNSRMGRHCRHTCEQCLCGCDRVSFKCMPCGTLRKSSLGVPERGQDVQEREPAGPLPWSTSLSALTLVTLTIAVIYKKCFGVSTQKRDKHVQYVLDQLTSNASFRFVRSHHQEEEGEPHGSPCFDMNTICQVGRQAVLRQLDLLLGENESYEHFRKSFRYKEFRLAVANKIWATETQRRRQLSVGKNNCSNDSLMARTKHTLKIRIGTPLELAADSRLEVDDSFLPSSILKEGSPAEDALFADKCRHTVRFSSATSLVLFSTGSSSSVAGPLPDPPNSV